jgi:lipoprotein signal peptidase
LQRGDERKELLRWLGLTCLLVAVDQASKLVVRSALTPASSLSIFGDIVRVTFLPNYRGFSWFVPVLPEWFTLPFLVLRLLIFVLAFPVYEFYRQAGRARASAHVALIGISAGILGNTLDDLFMPYTTDFIQVIRFPAANFADLCSFVGLGALVVEFTSQWRSTKPHWRGFRYHWTHATKVRREFLTFLRHYLNWKR